jgi:prevent-host-death family protein
MKTVLLSEFKAKCIGLLREAQRNHESIVITRRGRPIARVEPLYDDQPARQLGVLRGRMRIHGDLVETGFAKEWEIE